MINKLQKIWFFTSLKIIYYFSMKKATKMQIDFYKKWGMKMEGTPRYISALTLFDGTDYGLITLGEGITISSNVRILTHDWAVDTVHMAFASCDVNKRPIGQLRAIKIGDYSFVGTGSIIMPGCELGKGVIVGAGSVVRGKIPDFSIVIGSPATIIGDSREYCKKTFEKIGCSYEEIN